MSAAASPYDPPALQRAKGELVVTWRDRQGTTALADLRQDGCLKARFPRPTGWAEAVMLNSSGGVAAGDGESQYDHRRYGAAFANSTIPSNFTEMSKTEMDMLAAPRCA